MDLTTQVIEAINGWLAAAAAQVLGPALGIAGRLLFSTPAFDTVPEIAATWAVTRGMTDALVGLALLVMGVTVMTRGGTDVRYAAKSLLPRLVLAAALANVSLALCGGLIGLNNALVDTLIGGNRGSDVLARLPGTLIGGGPSGALLGALVDLAAAAMAVLLAVLYVARDLGLVLAIVLAPLALVAAALPQGEELARLWARLFGALLFIQVVQAALVAAGIRLLQHPDWLGGDLSALSSGLVLITLLFVLIQLPIAACRWALGQPSPVSAPAAVLVRATQRAMAA